MIVVIKTGCDESHTQHVVELLPYPLRGGAIPWHDVIRGDTVNRQALGRCGHAAVVLAPACSSSST